MREIFTIYCRTFRPAVHVRHMCRSRHPKHHQQQLPELPSPPRQSPPLPAATLALCMGFVLPSNGDSCQHHRHNKPNVFVIACHLFPPLVEETNTTESLHDERADSMASSESALLFALASLLAFSSRSFSSAA